MERFTREECREEATDAVARLRDFLSGSLGFGATGGGGERLLDLFTRATAGSGPSAFRFIGLEMTGGGRGFWTGFWRVTTRVVTTTAFVEEVPFRFDFEKKLRSELDWRAPLSAVVIIVSEEG